jgi:hypothetical protein
MAAIVNFCEDHGAATGSPAKGTTRDGFAADTNYATSCGWKSADDTNVTSISSATLSGLPTASYEKFQYAKFTGTFSRIFNAKWTAHASPGHVDYPADKIRIWGAVTSAYTTPAQTNNAALTRNFSSQVFVFNGLPVLFSTTGPEDAAPTAELTAAGYTQYLVSQMQVASGATVGLTNKVAVMLMWEEE